MACIDAPWCLASWFGGSIDIVAAPVLVADGRPWLPGLRAVGYLGRLVMDVLCPCGPCGPCGPCSSSLSVRSVCRRAPWSEPQIAHHNSWTPEVWRPQDLIFFPQALRLSAIARAWQNSPQSLLVATNMEQRSFVMFDAGLMWWGRYVGRSLGQLSTLTSLGRQSAVGVQSSTRYCACASG